MSVIRRPGSYRRTPQTKDSRASKAACERKSAYSSERKARQVGRDRLAIERREKLPTVGRLWCYPCPCCRLWHLTSVQTPVVAITPDEMWDGVGL